MIFFIPQNELDASVVASLDLYTDLQLDTLCGSDPSFAPTDACFLTFDAVSSDGSVNLKNFLLIGEPKDAPLQVADVTVSFWFPNCILFEKKDESKASGFDLFHTIAFHARICSYTCKHIWTIFLR